MVQPVAMAVLPGFPRPLMDGPLFTALIEHVAVHGQPRPFLVDRAGVVWGERTMWNVCLALGRTASTCEVVHGPAAAVQELASRDLTVLEQADLVLAVYEDPGIMFMLDPAAKRAVVVSSWFRTVLGKDRGFSPNQIERYLRVARSPAHLRSRVARAPTLNQALRTIIAGSAVAVAAPYQNTPPSAEEAAALAAAEALADAMQQVRHWSPSSLGLLRRIRSHITSTLRAHSITTPITSTAHIAP